MKKFIVSMLLLLPLTMVAQELKIATVDQNEIFSLMPEVTKMNSELEALQNEYQELFKSLQDEYNNKAAELTAKGDSLSENIRILRINDLTELESRMENIYPVATEAIDNLRQKHLGPIQDKVMKAIESVGEENGYSMIINPQVLLYKGNAIIDATEKVKAKMGLK